MRIITLRILGTDETHTATIEGQTKAEADGNAIRTIAAGTKSAEYTIGRKATKAEAATLPHASDFC